MVCTIFFDKNGFLSPHMALLLFPMFLLYFNSHFTGFFCTAESQRDKILNISSVVSFKCQKYVHILSAGLTCVCLIIGAIVTVINPERRCSFWTYFIVCIK